MPNSLFYVNPPPRLPLAQLFYMETFAVITQFDVHWGTGGFANLTEQGIQIDSGDTSTDTSDVGRTMDLYFYPTTWDKRREFKCHLKAILSAGDFGQAFLLSLGSPISSNGMGLWLNGDKVYAISGNAINQQLTEILDLTEAGGTFEFITHCKHFPGSHVEFWVNDLLVASHDTFLPTGTDDANTFFNAFVTAGYDDPNYLATRIETGYFEVYQEV
jgi:hypothetical protein